MKFLSAAVLLIGVRAFAAPGMQEISQPNYKKLPVDTQGQCTAEVLRADTLKSPPDANGYLKSYCVAMLESLQNEPCIKQKLEQIRLLMLKQYDEKAAQQQQGSAASATAKKSITTGMSCMREADSKDILEDVVRDKSRFQKYMMVYFSTVAAVVSNSRVLNNSKDGAANSQDVKCEGPECGFMGIRKKDMDNPKYAQCGCGIGNKEDNQKQFDPTMDGTLNIRCAIGMSLTEVLDSQDEDIDFLGGRSKDKDGKDTRKGLAKIIPQLEQGDLDEDSTDSEKNPNSPKELVKAKMKEYCQSNEASSTTNEWKRELPDQNGDAMRDRP